MLAMSRGPTPGGARARCRCSSIVAPLERGIPPTERGWRSYLHGTPDPAKGWRAGLGARAWRHDGPALEHSALGDDQCLACAIALQPCGRAQLDLLLGHHVTLHGPVDGHALGAHVTLDLALRGELDRARGDEVAVHASGQVDTARFDVGLDIAIRGHGHLALHRDLALDPPRDPKGSGRVQAHLDLGAAAHDGDIPFISLAHAPESTATPRGESIDPCGCWWLRGKDSTRSMTEGCRRACSSRVVR